MKKQLIIINQDQFGYHNDTYYYCKYLKTHFNLVYIGWDHGYPKIKMQDVHVFYVNRQGNMIVRTWRFLNTVCGQMKDKKSIVFIKYFKIVSLLLKILKPKDLFVLDIRTGSVQKNAIIRWFQDAQLKFEILFFNHVTVISKSLVKKLGIDEKAHILPLGSDVISFADKSFDTLDLIYVGTLFNRNLDTTIHGFKKFCDEYHNRIHMSYTIIGDGPDQEANELRTIVCQKGLFDMVRITGCIPHTELAPFFDKCNIGVSYIPMTDYYDCQPVTKTFEYILSGMPVIGTKTSENQKVINTSNGVLISDTSEEFYLGLKQLFDNLHIFDSNQIRKCALEHTWENIVNQNLKMYLYKIDR